MNNFLLMGLAGLILSSLMLVIELYGKKKNPEYKPNKLQIVFYFLFGLAILLYGLYKLVLT